MAWRGYECGRDVLVGLGGQTGTQINVNKTRPVFGRWLTVEPSSFVSKSPDAPQSLVESLIDCTVWIRYHHYLDPTRHNAPYAMDDTPDLDTNAFLESVRELKEKRRREDNERQEQLEAQIASSRLARKLGVSHEPSQPQQPGLLLTDRRRERARHAVTNNVTVHESAQGLAQQRHALARQHSFAPTPQSAHVR